MLLSIIVISYNEAEYLTEAIESCLNQRGIEDFEIIIADDGSTDQSMEIIKLYAQQYPKKIKYIVGDQEDGVNIPSIRVSNNIKKAMSIASGQFFACLSGDDYFCDLDKFKKQTDFLQKNEKYVAIASNYKYVWPDETERIQNWNGVKGNLFWSGEYAHISCFMFRRSVYEHGLLEHFCDDVGLIYSIANIGDWYYSKEVMFAYRQRSGSIMHSDSRLQSQMLELLLLEDILSSKQGKISRSSTWSRYAKPLRYVWKHNDKRTDKFYAPKCEWMQVLAGCRTSTDVSRIKIRGILLYSSLCWLVYFPLRKINKLWRGVLCR